MTAVRHAGTWYTGLSPAEDAAQVAAAIHDHRWVDGALGAVGGGLDTLGLVIDPLGSLAFWGVSWLMEHVRPLREALDQLAGNPDAVSAHAAAWQNVGRVSAEAAAGYSAAIRSETAGWQGDSGDAYRLHAGIQVAKMQGISHAAYGISAAVQGAGLLVGMVRGIVRDLIAQFVATLAARLPEWLAEEGLSLGLGTPVVVAQVAALVATWVQRIQRFLRSLLDSLRRLLPLVDRLGHILEDRLGAHAMPPASRRTTAAAGWQEGDPVPPARTGDVLPADAHLLDRFHGENDPANPHRAFYPNIVHYMTPAEREQHRLFVDADGKLRRAADGSRYDTSAGATAWSTGGRAIFVMDGSGNLYAALDQHVGHLHHSSLLGGQPVAGAGEIEVRDGKLVAMTDQSGHYEPAAAMNDRVLQSLRDQGLSTDPGFQPSRWNQDGEVTVDPNTARGVMNQLLYPIDGAPDLSEATAARLAGNLIDGRLYAASVAEFAEAIDQTLRTGRLHPQTAEMSRRYDEPDLLDFLRRVARHLDEHRPWPPPKITKLPVAEWRSFAAAVPIARLDRPAYQIRGAIGYPFDEVPAGAVLLLHLRTGETIALLGSADPEATSFVLLQRDPGDPAGIIADFSELTGLPMTRITTSLPGGQS